MKIGNLLSESERAALLAAKTPTLRQTLAKHGVHAVHFFVANDPVPVVRATVDAHFSREEWVALHRAVAAGKFQAPVMAVTL